MRLWSLHPKYLDSKGLVALWREALLARAVLKNKTRGYKSHPQLARFKEQKNPVAAINAFLFFVWKEASERKYCFDESTLERPRQRKKIPVTRNQLEFEFSHLKRKLSKRNQKKEHEVFRKKMPEPNPLFATIPGPIAQWEKKGKI